MADAAPAYGELICERSADGTVTVVHGPDTIGVAPSLVGPMSHAHITEDGLLRIDTAGRYVYRPVRFDPRDRVIVCARVHGGD